MIELRVTSLTKKYGYKSVFSDLNFISTSTVMGIAGANGSGKSTLLRVLSGLLKPTSGKIEWTIDRNPVDMAGFKQNIGYTAPYVELYEELTVFENLEFILKVRGLSDNNTIPDQLKKMDAVDLSGQFYGSLSTGQRQRIKLAAAMIHQPSILFLDEPGSNLDKKGLGRVEQMIQEFKSSRTFVLIASNLSAELDLCDQIFHLTKTE